MTHHEQDRSKPDWRAYLRAFEHARQRFQDDPTPHTLALLEAGEEILYRELAKPGKFALGQLVATIGASEAMRRARQSAPEFLLRHQYGDWGHLEDEDRQANEAALLRGSRLFSAYYTRLGDKLWIITVRLVTGWWIAAAGS
jgi:hypothetical protein